MSEQLWARLKLHNPAAGCTLRGLHYAGRLFRGGDGITQIPEWVPVNMAMAQVLSKAKQNDTDPRALPAFDIVTESKRIEIDQAEEIERRYRMGFIPRPMTGMPGPQYAGQISPPAPTPSLVELSKVPDPEAPTQPAFLNQPHVLGVLPPLRADAEQVSSIASPELMAHVAAQHAVAPPGAPVSAGLNAAMATIQHLTREIAKLQAALGMKSAAPTVASAVAPTVAPPMQLQAQPQPRVPMAPGREEAIDGLADEFVPASGELRDGQDLAVEATDPDDDIPSDAEMGLDKAGFRNPNDVPDQDLAAIVREAEAEKPRETTAPSPGPLLPTLPPALSVVPPPTAPATAQPPRRGRRPKGS